MRIAIWATAALCACAPQTPTSPASPMPQSPPEPAATITAPEVQAHINWLADDKRLGRYFLGPGAKAAAVYIEDAFEAAGLKPFAQQIPVEGAAPNVLAFKAGTSGRYVIIGAHYDHLRPASNGDDRIYNGADDNASGVAGLLEIAEAIGTIKSPDVGILLAAFTGEEVGFLGSRYLANHLPYTERKLIGIYNMDMISRGEPPVLYAITGGKAPILLQALKKAHQEEELELIIDPNNPIKRGWLKRSDQWPFIDSGYEGLYVGVDDHADYHKVSDEADKVNAELAAATARLVLRAALNLE